MIIIKRFFISICTLVFSLSLIAQKDLLINKFKGHDGPVYCVSFSEDGSKIVSGAEDKKSIVWDVETGSELQVFDAHAAKVQAVTFRKGYDEILSAGGNYIKHYTMAGEHLNSFTGHSTYIYSIDVTKDGQFMVTGSLDKKFRLWNIKTNELIHVFEGHDKSVLPVCFSPNGKYIASGSLDQSIKIWDVNTKEELITLPGHADNIYSLCFSHSGEYLLSASRDNTIKLWDVSSGKIVKVYTGHTNAVVKAIFTPDDNHIISASHDMTIRVWQTKTAKTVYSFIEHEGAITSIDLSSDGSKLISSSFEGEMYLWDFNKIIFLEDVDDKINEEIEASGLFTKKDKGESKEDYAAREEKALAFKKEVINKYYQIYIRELRDMEFKKDQ